MFLANVFGRKNRLFASPSSANHRHSDKYRLLRFEALDDRVLLAITTASVPDDLSTGPATSPTTPLSSTFFDVLPVAAPSLPGTTAQTGFPTPDTLLSGVPFIPVPVVVPDSKGWVFQAGGGGFPTPPIDNASDNDYPVALNAAPGGVDSTLVIKPAIVSEAALDSVLADLPAIAPKSEIAASSGAESDDTALSPDLFDAALASADEQIEPSALLAEISAAAVSSSP
ncbi:MAG TPA: hypothetical protein VHV55_28445 [Pirellulales bacterium]|jgi:hypothetical protein|nr:hypothetical protein [Pirellulales bacterium]